MDKWRGKKVAILGWGVDSQDVEPWLRAQGAEIMVRDEKKEGRQFGDLSGYDALVRSPGVYRLRKEIVEAGSKGVEITSKTKIFFDVCPGKVIGVTGTKGKGTTSSLIYQILKKAGKKVFIGGNIGEGVFGNLKEMDKETWVVLEMSSFQLIDLCKSPTIAVVLMVTSEHLDWHKDVAEYINAKGNITKWQKETDVAVVNRDYENSVKIGKLGAGKKVWVSGNDLLNNGRKLRLKGEHNLENIAAALAVAKEVGISEEKAWEVICEFKGLEHRLEEVATVEGVTYYDDSFSTTPETAIAAIKAFDQPEIIILGGSDKGSDYTELGKVVRETENIKAVILIGQMAGRIREAIGESKCKILEGAKNMKEIVEIARNEARSGDVVVLSPACASFGMFTNYKDRGEQFKREVSVG